VTEIRSSWGWEASTPPAQGRRPSHNERDGATRERGKRTVVRTACRGARAVTAIPRARETVAQSLLEQRDRHRGDDALRHVTRPTTRWWVGRRHPCVRCGTLSRPACCSACCWGAAWLGRAPRGWVTKPRMVERRLLRDRALRSGLDVRPVSAAAHLPDALAPTRVPRLVPIEAPRS
jgi:hypothetical protein